MTHPVPSRKPLDSDALFKTLRGLHPSKPQLDDIAFVEKVTLDRLQPTGKVIAKLVRGRGASKKNPSSSQQLR